MENPQSKLKMMKYTMRILNIKDLDKIFCSTKIELVEQYLMDLTLQSLETKCIQNARCFPDPPGLKWGIVRLHR